MIKLPFKPAPAPAPARPSAPAAPAAKPQAPTVRPAPQPAAVRAKFGNEFSSGQGSALRTRALSTTGATSTAATSLRTEVRGDGRANCLENAANLAQPGDQVMLLGDSDGIGHAVVVRPDGSVLDPSQPEKPYANVETYLASHPNYTKGPTVSDRTLEKLLSIPPGPQRELFIQASGLSAIASRQVAGETLYAIRDGVRLRNADGSIGGSLRAGEPLTVIEPAPTAEETRQLNAAARGTYQWVRVQRADGSTGFVASQLTSSAAPSVAASSGGGAITATGGGPRRAGVALGSNYTDLGVNVDGQYPRLGPDYAQLDLQAMEANVAADLDRLAAAGITDLRVWAQPVNDPAGAAARIGIIARQAAARGMTVTVDLLDMHREAHEDGHKDPGAHDGQFDAQLRTMIDQVVAPNAGHGNLRWSIGNEPASGADRDGFDPAENVEFANWMAGWNNELAAHVGRDQVSLELTPTAVGRPPDPRAMQILIRSASAVNIHFYPEVDPTIPLETQVNGGEFQDVLAWKNASEAAGRPFTIGEFGIQNAGGVYGDPRFALSGEARTQALDAWLTTFAQHGITNVRLWQFMKNEAGHVDGWSFDDSQETGRHNLP